MERCNKKIRPLDSSKKLSLCRYYWKCERRDHCIYAHSIKELDNWNTSHQASHRNSEPNSLPLHQVSINLIAKASVYRVFLCRQFQKEEVLV